MPRSGNGPSGAPVGGPWTWWRGRPGAGWSPGPADGPVQWAWLASGRAALRWLLEVRFGRGVRVLAPAYTCAAVVQALREAGAACTFFPVDADLEADWDAVDRLAFRCRPQVLFLIHYFGRLQDPAAVRRFRARHPAAAVVEDVSHSLLNSARRRGLGPLADYACGSLRKLLPIPEGGVVADLRSGVLPPPPIAPGARSAAAAMHLAAEILDQQAHLGLPLPRGEAESLHARAELRLDAGEAVRAPAVATRSLLARLPASAFRARRRANWARLAATLADVPGIRPLHAVLEPGWAPLGFVVRCRNRHDVWRGLQRAGIEATVHWPLPAETAAAAGRPARLAAGTLLTLPCDPRYGPADMDRIARAVRAAAGAAASR